MAAPARIRNHPLLPAVAALLDALEGLPPEFQEQQELIGRVAATAKLLRERLDDPAVGIVSDTALSNAQSWIKGMLDEVQSAVANNNPNLLATGTLLTHLDSISQNLGQFPVSQPIAAINSLLEEAQARLQAMHEMQLQQEQAWRAANDQRQRLITEAVEAKEEGLKRLREQEVAAGKLLAALGAEGTSTGYRLTADAERKQADFWRWVTIAAGIVTAILGVTLFLTIHEQSTATVATRIAVVLPLVLLTGYAGKQSAGHRTQEREARRLELAFGSVDAYLADLDAIKRAELKGALTASLYRASHGEAAAKADGYPTTADLVPLLNEAIKRLR
jgi:hypothetical protein